MKKNWEIIREILLRLESTDAPNARIYATNIDHYPEQEVAYNMRLLDEAGYIEAKYINSNIGDGKIASAFAVRLMNPGHELLEVMRNDTVWNMVKEKAAVKGIDLVFAVAIKIGHKVMEAIL